MPFITDKALFNQIASYCLSNLDGYPYECDFFQENLPVMRALYMPDVSPLGRLRALMQALYMQGGHIVTSRIPGPESAYMWIWNIEELKHEGMFKNYTDRRNAIAEQLVRSPAQTVPAYEKLKNCPIKDGDLPLAAHLNEYYLFSGYTAKTLEVIVNNGVKPHLGSYDPGVGGYFMGKGFGALGRGAYFTDRIAKAMTYAPCPNCGRTGACSKQCMDHQVLDSKLELRRLLLSRVVLGNCETIAERGKYRFKHHNEMVKTPIASDVVLKNEVIAVGEETARDTPVPDSLVGVASYASGGSFFTAVLKSNAFDSDEYLVRNADQIKPSYVIYYSVVVRGEPQRTAAL